MEKIIGEIPIVKDKLRAKFKKKGLNKDQAEIKLNSLDCEFCTHAFVNDIKLSSAKERLKLYLDFLKRQL